MYTLITDTFSNHHDDNILIEDNDASISLTAHDESNYFYDQLQDSDIQDSIEYAKKESSMAVSDIDDLVELWTGLSEELREDSQMQSVQQLVEQYQEYNNHIISRINHTGITIEDNRIQLHVSIADPRGAFVMELRQSDDGTLYLHTPHEAGSLNHTDLKAITPGTMEITNKTRDSATKVFYDAYYQANETLNAEPT